MTRSLNRREQCDSGEDPLAAAKKMWRAVVCSSLVVALVTTALLLAAVIHDGVALAAWETPASEKARRDPLPSDAKTLELGERVAKVNCAPCHGSHFKGDGPAGATLSPKPADWTSTRVQDQTDGELFWKISEGRGAMPSWKHLSEKERWAVVRFIKSLRAGHGAQQPAPPISLGTLHPAARVPPARVAQYG